MERLDLELPSEERWHQPFRKFISTGEADEDFLTYLDSNEDCQVLIEQAFKREAAAFEEIMSTLRKEGDLPVALKRPTPAVRILRSFRDNVIPIAASLLLVLVLGAFLAKEQEETANLIIAATNAEINLRELEMSLGDSQGRLQELENENMTLLASQREKTPDFNAFVHAMEVRAERKNRTLAANLKAAQANLVKNELQNELQNKLIKREVKNRIQEQILALKENKTEIRTLSEQNLMKDTQLKAALSQAGEFVAAYALAQEENERLTARVTSLTTYFDRTLRLVVSSVSTNTNPSPLKLDQEGYKPPELVKFAEFKYPVRKFLVEAEKRGIESSCLVRTFVSAEGIPVPISLTKGPARIQSYALQAVADASIRPARLEGEPIGAIHDFPVNFVLGESEKVVTASQVTQLQR